MRKKIIPILIVAVLVVGGITGVALANIIGKDNRESELGSSSTPALSETNTPASLDTSAAEEQMEEENLLPEDVSQPNVGADTLEPKVNIDTDLDFNDGDFYTYFLDFSLYFHNQLNGVADLRTISGSNWLTASFVANYTWAADYGRGIEYPYDDEGHVLIPITRLEEACLEIFGFTYDFAELAAGDYGYMIVDGSFTVPDGYDMMGAPYADLSTAQLTVKGDTITLNVSVIEADFDNQNPRVYGNFRYTFKIDNDQYIVPYRLVSIEAI